MPYPRLPTNKQYGTWFPEIAVRAVPSAKDVSSVDSAPVSMHESGGDRRSETLSGPKKIELGVLRVWVEGGSRRSKAYDDGPSFDYGAHGIAQVEDGEDGFNFAPGTDEKALKIRWEVYGLDSIKSAKLELFCKGQFTPIWAHHWGNAWGKQTEAIDGFLRATAPSGITALGEFAFEKIQVDTALKTRADDGTETVACPKGLLGVAGSPYQLRLTVSGCTADKTPADGDDFVYPMTAWTHLHVLVDSFAYRFGLPAWLGARDDGVDVEAEKQLLEELRGFVKGEGGAESMSGETNHVVALTSNHIKSWGPDELAYLEKAWGKGPRIPVVASARIRTLAKGATADRAADVMAGARVLWDWCEPDPARPKTLAAATKTIGDGQLTKQFLEKVSKQPGETYHPRGSFNCPKEHGGKYGDDTLPILAGGGGLPWEVKPCGRRSWAVVTVCDDKGETGVLVQPSRFPGDAYKVRSFLHDEALDQVDEPAKDASATGSPGVFTVHRRVKLHHLVVGDMPGVSARAQREAAVAAAARQAYLILDFAPEATYAGAAYVELMKEAAKNLILNTLFVDKYYFHGVELPYVLKTGGSPGAALMAVEDHTTVRTKVERLFRDGAVRLVKKLFDLDKDRLGKSDAVVGAKNKSAGCLLDLGDKHGADPIVYAISEPGAKPFENGETVTGVFSGKARSLTLAADRKSVWEVTVARTSTDAHGKTVRVKFPGPSHVDLEFTKDSRLSRHVSSELTPKMKQDLTVAFNNAVSAFNDGTTFVVTIEGHEGESSSSKRRIDNVEAAVRALVKGSVIQRKEVFGNFVEAAQASGDSSHYAASPNLYATDVFGPGNLYGFLRDAIAFTHAKKEGLREGLLVVHSSRFSTVTDFADQEYKKIVKGKAAGAFTDYPTGGSVTRSLDGDVPKVGLADPAYEKLGVNFVITPDPDGARYAYKGEGGKRPKKPWTVLLHEIGHGLHLEHAKATRGNQVTAPPPYEGHLKDDPCIMSYDAETDQFCGLCMLRLRGWKWREFGEATPYTARISLELGDVSSIFPRDVRTTDGKRARVQVLGLFNRPLAHADDLDFREEFDSGWDYAWKLAKKVVPGLDRDLGKLDEAVAGFIVEGGKLPAEGEQAKLRVWAHHSPYYANMDLALRYGDLTVKNVRENLFRIGAIRGDIEALFTGSNPSIGVYPMRIEVKDGDGNPLPFTEVWVTLIDPEPPAKFDAGFAGAKVLGATSFVKGAAPAPIAGTPALDHVKSWFDRMVKPHDASGPDDPQRDNAHFTMGGKRRMRDDGNVSMPVNGIRNVFSPGGSDSETAHLPQPIAANGSKLKHSIALKTDEDGIATFRFTPSLIGGDAYRLRIQVPSADKKGVVGRLETGTMVVWRTHRVGAYYQMPNAADESQLPASYQQFLKRLMTNYLELYRPIEAFDLRRSIGDELARAFCEVLFDDEALRPTPIDDTYWQEFGTLARSLNDRYSVEHTEMYFNAVVATTLLTPVSGSPRTYRGRLQRPMRGFVAISTVRQDAGCEFELMNSLAHDYHADGDPEATTAALVELKAGDTIFGFDKEVGTDDYPLLKKCCDKYKAAGAKIGIADGSVIDYTTGEVTVKLAADLPVPAPNWCNANDQYWGPLGAVTGATLANTAQGRLFALQREEKKGWSIYVYKHWQMAPESLVAAARKLKPGAQNVRVRAENGSGLNLVMGISNTPKDGLSHMFHAGLPLLHAGYIPERVVDSQAILEPVERSPCLVSYRSWSDYNAHKRDEFPEAPAPLDKNMTWFEKVTGGKRDYSLGETVFMRALSGAARAQGFAHYPGLVFFQANYMNNIDAGGLGGKGVANTAFINMQGVTDPAKVHYLVLHEAGHCLFFGHAPKEPGHQTYKWFHDTDNKFDCVMGRPPADDVPALQTFCGKCNAALRGLLTMEEPLWPAGEQAEKGAPKPGNAAVARKPVLGDPTGGQVIPDTVPDPHEVPPTPTVEEIEEMLVVTPEIPPDDQQEECAIEFIPQEKSNWCWAASSLIVRRFFLPEDRDLTQAQLAREALGHEDDVRHALPLIKLDLEQSGEGTPLSFDDIKKEIDEDRPFIVARAEHYLVGYGYSENGGQWVLCWDPLPVGRGEKKRLSYAQYKGYIESEVNLPEGGKGRGANYYGLAPK